MVCLPRVLRRSVLFSRSSGAFLAALIMWAALLVCASPGWAQQHDPVSSQQAAAHEADEPPKPSYGELADTLQDPAARDRLIEQLRALEQAGTVQAQTGADAACQTEVSGIAVFSQRLGGTLERVTAQLGSDIRETFAAVSKIGTQSGVTQGKLEGHQPDDGVRA